MNRERIPVVRRMGDIGPKDPVFDLLILLGPVVIVITALAGRNVVTTAIAVAYLATFVCYTAYKAIGNDNTE